MFSARRQDSASLRRRKERIRIGYARLVDALDDFDRRMAAKRAAPPAIQRPACCCACHGPAARADAGPDL